MGSIVVIGLGPGDPNLITRQAWKLLSQADELYVRTQQHPTLAGLPQNVQIQSFDDLYETLEKPEDVYSAIAGKILELGRRQQGVLYAVPGSPMVAEASVGEILAKAKSSGQSVQIVQGLSFIEPALELVGLDALAGLKVVDALEVAACNHPPFSGDEPTILAQMYSRALASDVKLTLMNEYPDEHQVALLHRAGTLSAKIEWVPLHELDHSADIDHLTTLFIPPLPESAGFNALQETVAHLRAPDGCPWDQEQTHASLRQNLLEESYEVLTVIDSGDFTSLAEELGDMLLQIVLQTQIAIDEGEFQMRDVTASINSKLIRRHPHVFSDLEVDGVASVIRNWETLKAAERKPDAGVLSGVSPAMPALAQADSYQSRAARVGFDWEEISSVLEKLNEEIDELQNAESDIEQAAELGDVLFSVVNWARWLEINPEAALRESNARFRARFELLEERARIDGRELTQMTVDELEELWVGAKQVLGTTGMKSGH